MSEENLSSGSQISQMLDKVLSNPELIATVASALSASASKESEAEPKKESVPSFAVPADLGDKLPEIMNMLKPMLGPASSGKSRESDNRACLLNAVKPYVNPHRCEAIDYMIKFSRLAELIKSMN